MQESSENITLKIDEPSFSFQKKSKYEFCPNTLVNDDFINYIKFINRQDFMALLYLMEKMYKKERIFYKDSDYILFYKLSGAFNKIRQFYYKFKYPKYSKISDVNEYSLSLLPIKDLSDIVNLTINGNRYRFEATELLTIYKFSLNSVDENFYLSRELIPPKNPYTNIPFTIKQNITIFNQLKKYLFKIGKHLPSFLIQFKECHFNLGFYKRLNLNRLSLVSVNKYVDIMSNEEFKSEFHDIVQNESIKEIYCRHCYKKYDIYKIFKQTMIYYILNSNEIYIFGYYVMDFIKRAKINKIMYDDSHRTFHKMQLRRKKRSSRNSSRATSRRRLNRITALESIINNINNTTNTYNFASTDNISSIINIPPLPIVRSENSLRIRIPQPPIENTTSLSRIPPTNFIFSNPLTNTGNINADNDVIAEVARSVVDELIDQTVLRLTNSFSNIDTTLNRENTISNIILRSLDLDTSNNITSTYVSSNQYANNNELLEINNIAELNDFDLVEDNIKNKDYDEAYYIKEDGDEISSDGEINNISEQIVNIDARLRQVENRVLGN